VVASLALPDGLAARVLVAPPVSMMTASTDDVTPTLVLVPAHDQYGGPEPVAEMMGGWPAVTLEVVDGADHFLAGAIDQIASRVEEWVIAAVPRISR
jgi:alpha/beta superfamily hydrolase